MSPHVALSGHVRCQARVRQRRRASTTRVAISLVQASVACSVCWITSSPSASAQCATRAEKGPARTLRGSTIRFRRRPCRPVPRSARSHGSVLGAARPRHSHGPSAVARRRVQYANLGRTPARLGDSAGRARHLGSHRGIRPRQDDPDRRVRLRAAFRAAQQLQDAGEQQRVAAQRLGHGEGHVEGSPMGQSAGPRLQVCGGGEHHRRDHDAARPRSCSVRRLPSASRVPRWICPTATGHPSRCATRRASKSAEVRCRASELWRQPG